VSAGRLAEAHARQNAARVPSGGWRRTLILMSAMREEIHHLVDQLPEERLAPVLQLIRGDAAAERRKRAAATLQHAQERLRGVTGIDAEVARLRAARHP
jgi:hypothetical protein